MSTETEELAARLEIAITDPGNRHRGPHGELQMVALPRADWDMVLKALRTGGEPPGFELLKRPTP